MMSAAFYDELATHAAAEDHMDNMRRETECAVAEQRARAAFKKFISQTEPDRADGPVLTLGEITLRYCGTHDDPNTWRLQISCSSCGTKTWSIKLFGKTPIARAALQARDEGHLCDACNNHKPAPSLADVLESLVRDELNERES